jgi:hypothetical protein
MDPIQPDFVQTQSEDSPLNKILKVSLIVLIIISIGLGGFLLFQINNNKGQSPSAVIPTSTISPTVAAKKDQTAISPTVEASDPANIDIGSVEADLKGIETDVKGLQ